MSHKPSISGIIPRQMLNQIASNHIYKLEANIFLTQQPMASPNMKQMLPSSMSQVALLLMITILSCSCRNADARESMFFSKAIHRISLTTKSAQEMKPILTEIPVPAPEYALVESPSPAPSMAPETAPVAAPVSSDDGWYGHGTGVYSPEKETETTTTTTYPFDKSLPNDNEKYEDKMMSDEAGDEEKMEYSNKDDGDKYYNNYDSYSSMSKKNNEYSESYKTATTATNDNGYANTYKTNKKQGMSDTRFMENGKYYYDIDKMENANNQRQGMSDTRFMENGKYYYDVNKIEDADQTTDTQGGEKESYATETKTGSKGSYENESTPNESNKSKYVFDTMEEYYKSQGYHLNNPETYIP